MARWIVSAISLFIKALLFSTMPSTYAIAGAINISPITMTLSPSAAIDVMMVENKGTRNVIIEIQPQVWTQEQGENQLEPTAELIATPSVFPLKAGERRAVRIGFMAPPSKASDGEQAYRLQITETPLTVQQNAVQLQMRFSVPVFYLADAKASPALDVRLTRAATGDDMVLIARNHGDRHARIIGVKMGSNNENVPIQHGMASYILPKGEVEQHLKIAAGGATAATLLYAEPGSLNIREHRIVIGHEALHVSRD